MTDEVSLLICLVLLIGRVAKGIYFNQSEALSTQIRVVTSHQYGILRSFLRKCRGMSGVPQARTL